MASYIIKRAAKSVMVLMVKNRASFFILHEGMYRRLLIQSRQIPEISFTM